MCAPGGESANQYYPATTSRSLYVWSSSCSCYCFTIQLLLVFLCASAAQGTIVSTANALNYVGQHGSSSSHLHAIHPLIDAIPARQGLGNRWRFRGEPVRTEEIKVGFWEPPAAAVNTLAVGPGPSWYNRTASDKIAVVWISTSLDSTVTAFAEEVSRSFPRYENIIVFDKEPEEGSPWVTEKVNNVTFVQVNATVASAAGFSHSHVTAIYRSKKRTLAQDKALFYLARVAPDPNWSHVWLVEDDVFVPAPSSFEYLDAKYPREDILCKSKVPEQAVDTPGAKWFHWKYVQDVPPPRWRTLASAIRVSNRLLNRWLHFARKHGKLLFHETLPLTLAMNQANYTIGNPEEFGHGFACCNTRPPSVAAIVARAEKLPHTFWHRVKDFNLHKVYRDELARSM